MTHSLPRQRLRNLGIITGQLPTGPHNAITDVAGVRVGYTTLIEDTPHVIRTGVTAIWPGNDADIWHEFYFAGCHSFNGNGEMTGLIWIEEQGLLTSPICITNTHSVGVVRDALCKHPVKHGIPQPFHLPVVGETFDGVLSDAESFPVTTEHVFAALDSAKGGPIAEGNIGGGTGMICHEFKGGTGTASREIRCAGGIFTVGCLVQANYGERRLLRVGGAPVGLEIPVSEVPSHRPPAPTPGTPDGSIIVVLATDAPLLPIQCKRLARRATTGLAWVGGIGANSSGDIFLAFSTANRIPWKLEKHTVTCLGADQMTPLFQAAAEATEEAILNAMSMAETMTGYRGRTAHALPLDRLQEVMRRYGRTD